MNRLVLLHNSKLHLLSPQEAEVYISDLVTKKTIYARIDRPAGVVSFSQAQDPTEVLNEWATNLSNLMVLVSKTTHLINKEEMVHRLVKWTWCVYAYVAQSPSLYLPPLSLSSLCY